MKEQFIEFLSQSCDLKAKDVMLLNSVVQITTVKKGHLFSRSSEINRNLYFILDGITRYYVVTQNGEEQTSLFITENQFMMDIKNFYFNEPSDGIMRAETDCTFVTISKENTLKLEKSTDFWLPFLLKNSNLFFYTILRLNRMVRNLEAKEAYIELINFYPEIDKRVPLSHISSFLGITQFSLSRIRRQLSKD